MSVLDNGGFIGRTADYSDTSFYEYFPDINYNTAINSVSGGAPDFRWTLDATTNEEGSHSTTPTGTFSYTTGLIQTISDQSADMSGSEYLTIANDPLINGGTGYVWTKRSISFWFNADTTGSGTYPCIWEEGGGVSWMSIYLDNGLIYANVGESSTTGGHATASVSAGTTYHCLVTFDLTLGSNNIKIYLNGSLAGQATSSVGTALSEHTGDVRIGSGAARNHLNASIAYASYDGRLQDVCYWNEAALTATDASDIYNAGLIIIGNKKNSGLWNLDSIFISKAPITVFTDTFETFTGWTAVGSGVLSQSSTQAYAGTYSAYKTTNGDPNGAYKLLDATVNREYTLEAWIFSEEPRAGGDADRISIVDASGNGYGYRDGGSDFGVETRTAYTGSAILGTAGTWTRPVNAWYRIVLEAKSDNTFTVSTYDSGGTLLGTYTSPVDTTYSGPFDRVAILGGNDYYVDDLVVKRTFA